MARPNIANDANPASNWWQSGSFWLGLYLIVAFAAVVHLAAALWPSPLANQQARDALDREATRLELVARVKADSAKDAEAEAPTDTAVARRALTYRQAADSAIQRAGRARRFADSVAVSAVTSALSDSEVRIFGFITRRVSLEVRLILLALVLGALGSFIHASQSLATYVGNQQFSGSWGWWYVLRPFIGAALAATLYFAVRGALFPSALSVSGEVNPFGIAALATLAGIFSKQATDKLDEVFSTLFRTGPKMGDSLRADKLVPDTASTITKVTPNPVVAAGGQVTVTIEGTGFTASTIARLAEKRMTTTLNSDGTLKASIATAELPNAVGTFPLTVANVKGDGTVLASQPVQLEVRNA